MLPAPATEFYALQQRVNAATRAQVRRYWRRMRAQDLDSEWAGVAPLVLSALTQGQATVADEASGYLTALAAATGMVDNPVGTVNTSALVGTASDGRDLAALAYGGVVATGRALNAGQRPVQALSTGAKWLDKMVALQVADAARIATSIGACARPEWGGYVRYLNPPSCSRCAVLAGKWFKWNTGFDRHPRCDCQHFPVQSQAWAEAEGFIGNPDDAWRQGHIRDLTKVQQRALEDGADISQLINARRGMSTTTKIKGVRFDFTLEGVTRRGVYGRSEFAAAGGYTQRRTGRQGYIANQVVRSTKRSRITPETIYRVAENRADAIRLLKNYGYIL